MKRLIFFYILIIFNFLFSENNLDNKEKKYRIIGGWSFYSLLKDIIKTEGANVYNSTQARVRISTELSNQELNFLKNRDIKVKSAIENLISVKLNNNQIPRIALCFSGGGYRAMISALGALAGLKLSGLLDTVTYISALSGSTWAISSIYGHNLDLFDNIRLIKEQVSKPLYLSVSIKFMLENSLYKLFYGQNCNMVGIWGVLLAETLFSDLNKGWFRYLNYQEQYNILTRLVKSDMPKFSDFRNKIDDGQMPMPICTSIVGDIDTNNRYEWVEYNPYEIGFIESNTFIPSWSFGRKFINGVSTDYSLELGLDYLMGIWGSAFTVSVKELLENYRDSISTALSKTLDLLTINNDKLHKFRLSPAKVSNFAYSLDKHNLKNYKRITLLDAGLACNLPIAPLIRKNRKIDIMIIFDYSTNVKSAVELKKAEIYAKDNGVKLPDIDYSNIGKINIFKDLNADIPIIIYMPLIKNSAYCANFDPEDSIQNGYCSTFNLKYKTYQFDELLGLNQYNLISYSSEIVNLIETFLDNKLIIN